MKVRGKEKVQTKSAGARFTDMRTEQDVASPAAAVLERRQSTEPHDAAEAQAGVECSESESEGSESETGSPSTKTERADSRGAGGGSRVITRGAPFKVCFKRCTCEITSLSL